MSDFYLVHSTTEESLLQILKNGFLTSTKELLSPSEISKDKPKNKTDTNSISSVFDGENWGGDNQFIYTSIIPKSYIDNGLKEFHPLDNVLLVFDPMLLLEKDFISNKTWRYGKTNESEYYDGKKYKTEKGLENLLTKIYEGIEVIRKKQVKNIKNTEYKNIILREAYYYGELLFTTKIDLKKYLKYICIRINKKEKGFKDNSQFISNVIKYNDPYENTNIILYKPPPQRENAWKYFDDMPSSELYY